MSDTYTLTTNKAYIGATGKFFPTTAMLQIPYNILDAYTRLSHVKKQNSIMSRSLVYLFSCLYWELQFISPLVPAAIIVCRLLAQAKPVKSQGQATRCYTTIAVGEDLLGATTRAVNTGLRKDFPLILQWPEQAGRLVQ